MEKIVITRIRAFSEITSWECEFIKRGYERDMSNGNYGYDDSKLIGLMRSACELREQKEISGLPNFVPSGIFESCAGEYHISKSVYRLDCPMMVIGEKRQMVRFADICSERGAIEYYDFKDPRCRYTWIKRARS